MSIAQRNRSVSAQKQQKSAQHVDPVGAKALDRSPANELPLELLLHRLEEVSRSTVSDIRDVLDLPPILENTHGPPPPPKVVLSKASVLSLTPSASAHNLISGGTSPIQPGLEASSTHSNVGSQRSFTHSSSNISNSNLTRTPFGAVTGFRSVPVLAGNNRTKPTPAASAPSLLSGGVLSPNKVSPAKFGSAPCDAPPSLGGSSNLFSGRNFRNSTGSMTRTSGGGAGQSPEGRYSGSGGAMAAPVLGAGAGGSTSPPPSGKLGQLFHQLGQAVGTAAGAGTTGASTRSSSTNTTAAKQGGAAGGTTSPIDIIWLDEPPATSKHKALNGASSSSTSNGVSSTSQSNSVAVADVTSANVKVIDFGF